MKISFENRNFLITGSSRGIGKAIAKAFLKEGANVGLVARSASNLMDVSETLCKEFSSEIDFWPLDLTCEDSAQYLAEEVSSKWNQIDGLILNIGNGRSVDDPLPNTVQWSSVWKTNFDSALYTVRAFLPKLLESKGSIVFISSICGIECLEAPTDYSVAKSAIVSLSKNLSKKVAPHIRVNVVAPGNIYFRGGVWDEKLGFSKTDVDKMIEEKVPLKRFGKPEEIADAVVFLSSARASFITGTTLVVDGGQSNSF